VNGCNWPAVRVGEAGVTVMEVSVGDDETPTEAVAKLDVVSVAAPAHSSVAV
jgi:hypothetical protein